MFNGMAMAQMMQAMMGMSPGMGETSSTPGMFGMGDMSSLMAGLGGNQEGMGSMAGMAGLPNMANLAGMGEMGNLGGLANMGDMAGLASMMSGMANGGSLIPASSVTAPTTSGKKTNFGLGAGSSAANIAAVAVGGAAPDMSLLAGGPQTGIE